MKTKFRNRLLIKNLELAMRFALESPTWSDIDLVLVEATSLWKNSTKFRYLFSNPQTILVGHC
jgi:hypothetical protein